MRINKCDNTNFNGAFKFHAMDKKSYVDLLYTAPKTRFNIFGDVPNKRDVVYICNTAYNNKVMNLIKENNLEFEYFPNIKMNDKITKEITGKLIKKESALGNLISNIASLNSVVIKDNIVNSDCVPKYLNKILKTLRLNVEKPEIELTSNGLPKIRDNAKERTIYLSPNYENRYYVYIKPDSPNQESSRFLLSEKGKNIIKEYKTPQEIKTFKYSSCIIPE